jgi:hypothetical protein
VRGEFPNASSLQFIDVALVEAAARSDREYSVQFGTSNPVIMGVDVGRFGDDASVLRFRRGRDARSIPAVKLRGCDTMALAARIADEAARWGVDQIFIDGGGVGGGVVDRCRQMGLDVVEVQFGAKSDRSWIGQDRFVAYANKRAEIWGGMKEWLRDGAIDADPELIADLIGVEYGYVLRDGRDAIQLERKEDMKRRGLASPDNGDAVALTFSYPVVRRRHHGTAKHEIEYDPFKAMYGSEPQWRPESRPRYEPQPWRDRYGRG